MSRNERLSCGCPKDYESDQKKPMEIRECFCGETATIEEDSLPGLKKSRLRVRCPRCNSQAISLDGDEELLIAWWNAFNEGRVAAALNMKSAITIRED